MERLKSEARGLLGALGDRALSSIGDKVEGASGRLTEYVEGGAGPGLMAAVTGTKNLAEGKSPFRSMLGAGMSGVKEKVARMFGKGKGGGQRKLKLTNIAESIDVGVPVRVAYNQWTQYSDFPKFTKKVESVDHNKKEENKTNWKAQIFWSHRTWEATVIEQVPDERIIWRSKGQKGHVDGAVTFHELTPNLTRILLVLEYHPQGMFERTGNLWRAQGDAARDRAEDVEPEDVEPEDVEPEDVEAEDVEAAAGDEDIAGERDDDEDAGDDTRNGRAARRDRQSSERSRSASRASRGNGNRGGSNRGSAGQSNGRRRAAATAQRGGSR